MHQSSHSATSLNFFQHPSRAHYDPFFSTPTPDVTWPKPEPSEPKVAHQPRTVSGSHQKTFDSSNLSPLKPFRRQAPSENLTTPSSEGQRTPQTDVMNLYTPQHHHDYESQRGSIPTSAGIYSLSAATQTYSATNPHSRLVPTSGLAHVIAASTQSYSRPHSPKEPTRAASLPAEEIVMKKSSIKPNLQIPSSINDSEESLCELAAQVTCLFWFESISTLRHAETWNQTHSPVPRLVPDAIPTVSFRKWVVTILSTTQVTQNVIILALLFIFRLKTLNPTVKGKAGSEYRLLTVALMLGNKFLDDNTYTNKTWAEVSGISVGEIHVMEVEFLSNMRYSLLASKEQWREWEIKVNNFWQYFKWATSAPVTLPSPVATSHTSLLPSPPASMQSSPPDLAQYVTTSPAYHNGQWPTSYETPGPSPLSLAPEFPDSSLQPSRRKRSYDEHADEPPSKRVTLSNASQSANHDGISGTRQTLTRLPTPNLSISTTPNTAYSHLAQVPTLLPPPGSRAMSAVYSNTPPWPPQIPLSLTPTTAAHHGHNQSLGRSSYGTPPRRHSPRSTHDIMSANPSPISGNFNLGTPSVNSPSIFLQHRGSPYKPVRLPNTLLYPPPSASMHNFSTSIDQMHYQPLGKRNDYRSGVVPEYLPNPQYPSWQSLPLPQLHFHSEQR